MIDKKHHIHIASPGGVGSTMFIEWAIQHVTCNDPHDKDGLKHLSTPIKKRLLSEFIPSKGVFIFGNAKYSVVSLINRGYHNKQIEKINKKKCNFKRDDFTKLSFDPFGFKKQMINWLHDDSYEVLFIRYETMWQYETKILSFLNISATKNNGLPPKKIRSANFDSLDRNFRLWLENTYNEYDLFLDNLPDIFIRP